MLVSRRRALLAANRQAPHLRRVPAVLQIALDVARALVYLHSRRIIHLDIKSANVLLTRRVAGCGSLHSVWARQRVGSWQTVVPRCGAPCRDGTAKVGDVGMAKIMAGDYVSGVLGTFAWCVPAVWLKMPLLARRISFESQ